VSKKRAQVVDEPTTAPAVYDLASRLAVVPLVDLTSDAHNAVKHDEANLKAIESSLVESGQRRALVVQRVPGDAIRFKQGMNAIERTAGKLIVRAGNGTLACMKRLGWTHCSIFVFDDTEQQALRYAVADNKTSDLHTWDDSVLADLLKQLGTETAINMGFSDKEVEELCSLTTDTAQEAIDSIDDDVLPDQPRAFALRDDMRFEGAGAFDLPKLREDMLGERPTVLQVASHRAPVPGGLGLAYSNNITAAGPGGTAFFFMEDKFFERFWDDSAGAMTWLLGTKPKQAIGPDWSILGDWNLVPRLWSLYRSAWVSRYMQECGLRVIPNVQTDPSDPVASAAYVPKGAYVCVNYTPDPKTMDRDFYRALRMKTLEAIEPSGVLFYGDPANVPRTFDAVSSLVKNVDVVLPARAGHYAGRGSKTKKDE
jgi:hypothetical protein